MTDISDDRLAKDQIIRRKELIDKEIASHGRSWCQAWCQYFDPALYRHRRQSGYSAKEVQSNFDLCHRNW